MHKILAPWLLLALLLLAACGRQASDELETAATATTMVVAVPTSTPSREVTPTATSVPATPSPTATATPLPATISAIPQSLDEDGVVVISEASAPSPSWLVVYNEEEDAPGQVVGYVPLAAGQHEDVAVTVDRYQATATLYAALHADRGDEGTFEYPGADEPLENSDGPIVQSFPVELRFTVPTVVAENQVVTQEDGLVTIASAASPGPGWLAVQADDQGEAGAILGQVPLHEGANEDLAVPIKWREATRRLHAVLYSDEGEPGRFEPDGADQPILVNQQPVEATFDVDLPPDVFVINQPVVDGEVLVERAVINRPGWLAVYSDYSGLPDRLLGYTPLEAGANEQLAVALDGPPPTTALHLMLHEDENDNGEFDYPGGDPAVRDEGRMLLFSLQTDSGNYLITRDQPLGEEEQVVVPLVVVDIPSWVVVQADRDGEPGALLGRRYLPAGVHRDVSVTIDPDGMTEQLHVLLYEDAGTPQEFEPEGEDLPLKREGAVIAAPFRLLSPAE